MSDRYSDNAIEHAIKEWEIRRARKAGRLVLR